MSEKLKKSIKRISVITAILCLLITITVIVIMKNDNLRFKIEYEYLNNIPYENGKKIPVTIPWNNKIKYIEGEEILETLKSKTGIVYFGYNSCPWCRNVIGILIEEADNYDIDTIYYVDVHHSIEDVKEEIKEFLGEYLREDEETKEKVLGVPDVYFIKKGKIVGHHRSAVKSYKNPYKGMNQEQKDELREIYQKLIKEIKK